jgi:hypothetical protein
MAARYGTFCLQEQNIDRPRLAHHERCRKALRRGAKALGCDPSGVKPYYERITPYGATSHRETWGFPFRGTIATVTLVNAARNDDGNMFYTLALPIRSRVPNEIIVSNISYSRGFRVLNDLIERNIAETQKAETVPLLIKNAPMNLLSPREQIQIHAEFNRMLEVNGIHHAA